MNPQEDTTEVGMAQMMRWPSAHLLGAEDVEDHEQIPESSDSLMKRTRSLMLAGIEDMTSKLGGDLIKAAKCYETYGLQKLKDSWTYREWIPNAAGAYLVGDFNGWDTRATPLTQETEDSDVWSCTVPSSQASNLRQGQKYKVYVEWPNSSPSWLIPAWATRMTFTHDINMFDAVVYPVERAGPSTRPAVPSGAERIYECHLGLATREGSPKSFAEAAEVVIPRAVRNGYTAILCLGVQECKNYAELGAQPCAYFAPTEKLGTPEELRSFVQKAHAAGLRVYMSPAHEGAAWSADGLPDFYFRSGSSSTDPITGARLFDYDQPQVCQFLLANLAYWMVEYGFDGFRFDGVASMIYATHGRWLPKDLAELDEYVKKPNMVNSPAIQYLMLANSLAHDLAPQVGLKGGATTIAVEPSLFPGICTPAKDGGLGFDLRECSASGLFHGLLSKSDEDWCMEDLVQGLTSYRAGRPGEAVLACAQSARDCVVSKKPLKIAMLSWETLHTIAVGGVAPHVTELASALLGAGHEVHIFTRAQGENKDHEILGVHYHEVGYHHAGCMVQDTRNMCSAFVCALNGHESVWGAFDIVHGHDWLAGPGIMELKGQGKKVVFTMHSTEGGRNGDMGKGHPGIKDIERSACGAADKLISVSGVLRDEVCGVCGADGNKMSVIYNGIHSAPIVNMEWEDEWTGNAKEDKGFGRMDPMFLFVGRHTAQKGCDLLIEAIPNILRCRGDAKFVIVGDGHLLAHNQGRVHALGVGHAVCFTGSLKSGSAHLKALFRACDAVVVPSRNEPFGIVVLEAWASGKPVVATTSGGPRDFVKPGEDGYLVDPDPGSIAWGCCKILENFEHSRWMGKNAQLKAIREFSWEHIAKETEKVYYDLLNLQGAPRSNDKSAGCPLAHRLLVERCFDMKVNDCDPLVTRGLALLKLSKLLVASLSGDSLMTWMGTEFAQIDPVDMPRQANGFSDHVSRIKYELADNEELKFSQMEAFEASVNRAASDGKWLAQKEHKILVQSEEDKVLAYTRGSSLFVINLHPTNSYTDYKIEVPVGFCKSKKLRPVLNTDDARFGGSETGEPGVSVVEAKGQCIVTLGSLPIRTAFVFAAHAHATADVKLVGA
eukprot:gb/GFBE01032266.1/.p1 GENE.gb/GFBE01032266.1/~~gb/GFBE01032266.1/.p1  ORF type:complete len:1114 (+),score=262.19 gb/GFBE01032266.1/:1-3342(+)